MVLWPGGAVNGASKGAKPAYGVRSGGSVPGLDPSPEDQARSQVTQEERTIGRMANSQRPKPKGMNVMKKLFTPLLIGAALLAATPVVAQGIGHTLFMRGQVVAMEPSGTVICIGRADGAQPGQVLEVYRIETRHNHKSPGPDYRRIKVGAVTVTEVIDDHFARAQVTEGKIKKNDVVELRKS